MFGIVVSYPKEDPLQQAYRKYEEAVKAFKKAFIEGNFKIQKAIAAINATIKYNMCTDLSYANVHTFVKNGPVVLSSEGTKHPDIIFAGGRIRVGRIRGRNEVGKQIPITDGYVNIVVTSHNKKGLGHSLSPYVLCDSKGRLMENLWQFSKVYERVHKQQQPEWSWDAEIHATLDGGKEDAPHNYTPNADYWVWRQTGMEHDHAVRYPNGFKGKAECLYVLWPKSLENLYDPKAPMEKLSYVEARKKVYCRLYATLAKDNEEFKKLQEMLEEGINLQILDVDGPDVEKATKKGTIKAPYDTIPKGVYGETSGVGSIEITEQNIKLLMEDTDQPFGHGYVLACMLLDKTNWLK
jgi:hypothetical protein